MFFCRLICMAGMVAFLALPAWGQNTLIFHEFDGAAGSPLHGLPADVNNASLGSWVTRTDNGQATGTGQIFFDDGTINVGSAINGSATLAFTPTPGSIYTLSASLGAVTSTGANWLGLGFAAGQTSAGGGNDPRFISGVTAGQPWMLYRGSGAGANLNQTFLGPGTVAGVNWTTPVVPSHGSPVDLRIVLDTTEPLWTAEWFAKNPSDADYTSVGARAYTTNPTIGAVGIAVANTDVMATISSFRLETDGPVLLAGDVNNDGFVNILDFNAISDNLFNTGATREQGDLNGDGTVNFADFRLWKNIFEGGGGSAAGLVVPEPASWLLCVLGCLAAAAGWRRRGRR